MKKTFVRAAQALSMMVMAAAVIALSGCKKDDNGEEPEPLPEIELEVEPATSYFTYVTGAADVQVYCNDAWTATVDAAATAWCSVSPASGNGDGFVTITVTANTIPTNGNRTATVTITADNVTQTVAITQEVILATLCEACLWNGSTWVDGYVTTNAYPFVEAGTFTGLKWDGVSDWGAWSYNENAVSDRDGRANTAAITSAEGSAVQTCKDLGAGWYLPAYEELYNISAGNATWSPGLAGEPPLNGRTGKNLLLLPNEFFWSSTEFYNHTGRYALTEAEGLDSRSLGMYMGASGDMTYGFKTNESLFRCVWRPE